MGRRREVDRADDVGAPRHRRIEFTRLQGAVAGAIEDGPESISAKQIEKGIAILCVHGDDSGTDQLPGPRRPDAENLSGMAVLEIRQSIVAGDAGDASDEQRQRNREGNRWQQHTGGL